MSHRYYNLAGCWGLWYQHGGGAPNLFSSTRVRRIGIISLILAAELNELLRCSTSALLLTFSIVL